MSFLLCSNKQSFQLNGKIEVGEDRIVQVLFSDFTDRNYQIPSKFYYFVFEIQNLPAQ